MDASNEKRKIIVREIEHWRRSRLLPEQYCDFLLNIYMETDDAKPPVSARFFGISPARIRDSSWKMWVLVFFTVCAISFIVFNFNAFPLPLQIGLSLLCLVCFYVFAGVKREKEPVHAQVLLGMASLFILFIGVYLLRLYGYDSPVIIVGYVVLCSMVWMLTGLLSRLALFQLCGWVSLVFCYGWLLHRQLGTVDWFPLQLSWLPLAVLFCWMAWMIHDRSKRAGFVFFMVSLIVWYMPELYGMLYAEQYGTMTIQWLLLGKIIIEGALLYTMRKKWTEWVA